MQRTLPHPRHQKFAEQKLAEKQQLKPAHSPAAPADEGRRSRPAGVDVLVGAKLRAVRVKRGLSQEKLGSLLGVTFQQVQKYEKGSNSIAASRIPAVCEALQIKPADLFDDVVESLMAGQEEGHLISPMAWRIALAADRMAPGMRAVLVSVIKALDHSLDEEVVAAG
jgi:transcriptional regulator with XRE-family HTH domain